MAIEGRGEVGDRSAFMMMNSAGSERLHVFANLSHPVCDTVLCDDRWYSGMQRAQSCETEAFGVRKCCAAVDFDKTTRSHSLLLDVLVRTALNYP